MTHVAYTIGHEALAGKYSVSGLLCALKKQPACKTEILIASLTETLETKPDESGVQVALKMLRAAAKQLDSTPK